MSRLVAFLPLLAACWHTEDIDDSACAEYAAASVQVSVLDADGTPIDGATGTYTVTEGDLTEPTACDVVDAGELVCGWERRGTFEITVEAEGYASETVEVTVDGGPGPATTEMVTVTLDALD